LRFIGFVNRTVLSRIDAWCWLVGGSLVVSVIRGTSISSRLQTPLTGVQFACLLVALLVLWLTSHKSPRAPRTWVYFTAIGFGLFAVASTLWSSITSTTLSRSLLFLLFLIFAIESARIRWVDAERTTKDLMLFFWFAVIVSGIGLLLALFQVHGVWGAYNRFKGLTANADVAAWLAALAFPFGYAKLFVHNQPRRTWLIAGSLVLFVAVVASGTRGALLGLGAGILIIHLLQMRSWKLKASLVAAVLTIVLAVMFGILPGGRVAEPTTDISSGRLGLWSAGLKLWLQKPVGGWGFGTTSTLSGFSDQNGLSLHNAYLTVLIETGFVGLALFIALIVGIFARSGLKNHPAIAAAGAIVLINGCFESSLANLGSPETTQSWIILGALLAAGHYVGSGPPNANEDVRGIRGVFNKKIPR
jgi:hypothetical protein